MCDPQPAKSSHWILLSTLMGGQTVGVYVFSDVKVNDVYEYEINEQVCRRSILNTGNTFLTDME